jgi:uncharacterized membrane protein YkvA (DUF1232 family)
MKYDSRSFATAFTRSIGQKLNSISLAEALASTGVNTQNVREKLHRTRESAHGWISRSNAPEPLKAFVRQFIHAFTNLDIPLGDLAIIVGAVTYLIMPLDIVPDFIPILGWADDGIVLRLALKAVSNQWTQASAVHDVCT